MTPPLPPPPPPPLPPPPPPPSNVGQTSREGVEGNTGVLGNSWHSGCATPAVSTVIPPTSTDSPSTSTQYRLDPGSQHSAECIPGTQHGDEYIRELRISDALETVDPGRYRSFPLATSATRGSPVPCATHNPLASGATRNSPAPHPTRNSPSPYATRKHLRLWKNELLPWINLHMREIIGQENTGVIEFLPSADDPRPVIRIIAENLAKVNRSLLKSKLEDDEATRGMFMVETFSGHVCRSLTSEAYARLPGNPYQKRPSHGASLGIVNIPGRQHLSETLGGYICLVLDGCWQIYGLTCHHMLKDYSTTGDNSGVGIGEVMLCQPSLGHLKNFLLQNIMFFIENPCELSLEYFGRVICSSGYSRRKYERIPKLAESFYQNDWALITEIPMDRIGRNDMHMQQAPIGWRRTPRGVTTFETFKEYIGYGDDEKDDDENENMLFSYERKHIHGFGAVSGWQDGRLERDLVSVLFDNNGPTSLESVFTPRTTLVVGMINGLYSYQTPRGLITRTIYTPVHAVFEDIKRVTGVDAVCLPDFEHFSRKGRL
ncbi:hypothetical protein K440DRAFT_661897 [Wilcoxina mikolae CBS 423.85]|nr:hypothetical protein K440DRAFT_661897 [Wilcoxina mikolae CBS 423.85]